MSVSHPGYLRLVRVSAWYDLLITAGFTTPWTYHLTHTALSSLGTTLHLGPLPPATLLQTLYANLMASVVIIWSVLRIRRTLPVHGLYDGAARVLFSTWLAYALAHGIKVLWLFLLVEAAFGIAQLLPWRHARTETRVAGTPSSVTRS
ncbi:hypothetical protein [Streptomyces acidiscabies]|uniref:Uncharacterized protein n=1 Tax=Streptomyces acidiscabies TaxID=42234 RepID=A0A0L0K2E1_9ACTN|nr:hypothetical protein [Streptomyces acidiscabies]KND32232.1 hypothetical protein IQ63_23665 [Streptomyces acidiscabies]